MTYDLIIVGGGPAGCAAAVYAARKQLKTLVIAEEIGGQSSVSDTIYNWIGTKAIHGTALAQALREHIEEYAGEGKPLTLAIGSRAVKIEKDGEQQFVIELASGEKRVSRAVLVTSGSSHRKLTAEGAARFDYKGVMYCATCDGPLFSGLPVAVVGGGNAAFEAALQLSPLASAVTLIHRSDSFRADPVTVEMVKKDPKITLLTNAEVARIDGDAFVERLSYRMAGKDGLVDLPVSGVFVEIGQIPNTGFIEGLVKLDEAKHIVTDPYTQRTSVSGLWAAGDCTSGKYHQNNIAAGDAVKAIEDIYIWLKTGK